MSGFHPGWGILRNFCAGLQAVTAGANPIILKKGIDRTCEFLVKKLKELSRPVKGTDDIKVNKMTHKSNAH